jgi:hypothetical protein
MAPSPSNSRLCQSHNQGHVTTDGQSAGLSRCHAHTWGPKPNLYYCQKVASFLMCGALSDKRTDLSFTIALASADIFGSESRGTHDHILLSQMRDSPDLEGQVRIFISPRKWVAQLYPQALGSLFVALYDSKGYGGGIQTLPNCAHYINIYILGADPIENTAFNITSFVVCICCGGNQLPHVVYRPLRSS